MWELVSEFLMGDKYYEFKGFEVEVTDGMVKALPLVKPSPIQMGKAFEPQGCCDRSAHLVGHREEGFAFWGRLIGYLLQDHGNGLICSPRVFPLQQ